MMIRAANRRWYRSKLIVLCSAGENACAPGASPSHSYLRFLSSSYSELPELAHQPPPKKQDGNSMRSDIRWEEKFLLLKSSIEQNSALKQNTRGRSIDVAFPTNRELKDWLIRQRFDYQNKIKGKPSRMTESRIQKLESLGISLEKNERSFEERYEELKDFQQRNHGLFPYDVDISVLTKEEKSLRKWCVTMRKDAKYRVVPGRGYSAAINEERIAKLNELGFTWDHFQNEWEKRHQELQQYCEHHGHAMVPSTYLTNPQLALWVETQRRQKKLRDAGKYNNMTDRRLTLLNKLDFVWNVWDYKWEQKYNELKEYTKKNGFGRTPRHNDKANLPLREGLNHQRKCYRAWKAGEKSVMRAHRAAKLEELGFVFDREE